MKQTGFDRQQGGREREAAQPHRVQRSFSAGCKGSGAFRGLRFREI